MCVFGTRAKIHLGLTTYNAIARLVNKYTVIVFGDVVFVWRAVDSISCSRCIRHKGVDKPRDIQGVKTVQSIDLNEERQAI